MKIKLNREKSDYYMIKTILKNSKYLNLRSKARKKVLGRDYYKYAHREHQSSKMTRMVIKFRRAKIARRYKFLYSQETEIKHFNKLKEYKKEYGKEYRKRRKNEK